MASQHYALTDTWDAGNRLEAGAAEVDTIITNSGHFDVHFEITDSTAVPALAVTRGHIVNPRKSLNLKLQAGEYLWLAGAGAHATVLGSNA